MMNKAQASQFKRLVFLAVDEAVTKLNLDKSEINMTLHLDVQDTQSIDWPEDQ